MLAARCRRKYANAHTYHVNSIALSSDQETFITADDLRVNLWHLDISDQAFNVVDMKPANMDELTEVGTPDTQTHISTLICVEILGFQCM